MSDAQTKNKETLEREAAFFADLENILRLHGVAICSVRTKGYSEVMFQIRSREHGQQNFWTGRCHVTPHDLKGFRKYNDSESYLSQVFPEETE